MNKYYYSYCLFEHIRNMYVTIVKNAFGTLVLTLGPSPEYLTPRTHTPQRGKHSNLRTNWNKFKQVQTSSNRLQKNEGHARLTKTQVVLFDDNLNIPQQFQFLTKQQNFHNQLAALNRLLYLPYLVPWWWLGGRAVVCLVGHRFPCLCY